MGQKLGSNNNHEEVKEQAHFDAATYLISTQELIKYHLSTIRKVTEFNSNPRTTYSERELLTGTHCSCLNFIYHNYTQLDEKCQELQSTRREG
jgi:hypothetical protein